MSLARKISFLLMTPAFTVLALGLFLSPETARAARLTGEETSVQAVASQPQGTPPQEPTGREEIPEKAGTAQPAALAPSRDLGSMPPDGDRASTPRQTQKTAPPPAAAAQEKQYVTIDFDDVDIRVFIKFVSEATGRNFLLDERVKGKVTIVSPRKIAVDEIYNVLESILEIYGFTTVEAGEVIKVGPSLEARGKNLDLRLKQEPISAEDKVVTQILPLQHANPDEMKKILDPMISKTSVILSYPPTRMLIINDVLSNIKRLQEIVTALDVEGAGDEISYIPLQAASAPEIVKALNVVFAPMRTGVSAIRLVADERANSVILVASQQVTVHVKKLISFMDKEVPQSVSTLQVYRLQNGNAEDLVKVLMNIPKDSKDPKQAGGMAPVLSKDVSVVADKATNTLIITANRDDYRTIEGVIRQLDVPRPMVYIEALIMEVSVNKNFNVGVEWRGLKDVGSLNGLGSDATAVGMAGFTGQSVIPQVNATTGAVSMPSGLSLGIIGAGITIGGVLFPNIGAVLQAYQDDSDVSILSTPQLLTLNNEEAEINVGKNVPYITRSDTSTTSPGTTYGQSYEYKDVGVILKITPNINEEQFVRLKIDQQVTKLAGTQTSTPTTLKRTAKTTVVVKDKETVVIGGLIDDSTSVDNYQVPWLGDIPILGWLFKSRSKGREKSNLFIFITPHVVRNQDEAAAIYKKKLDDVGNVEEGIIKMDLKKTLTKPPADQQEREGGGP
jgi:general secretion pathway protein D